LPVSFKLVKWYFTIVGPLLDKCVCPPPGKVHYCPCWKISLRSPCYFVRRSAILIFLHMSHYPSNASFRDTSSMLV